MKRYRIQRLLPFGAYTQGEAYLEIQKRGLQSYIDMVIAVPQGLYMCKEIKFKPVGTINITTLTQ